MRNLWRRFCLWKVREWREVAWYYPWAMMIEHRDDCRRIAMRWAKRGRKAQ